MRIVLEGLSKIVQNVTTLRKLFEGLAKRSETLLGYNPEGQGLNWLFLTTKQNKARTGRIFLGMPV